MPHENIDTFLFLLHHNIARFYFPDLQLMSTVNYKLSIFFNSSGKNWQISASL